MSKHIFTIRPPKNPSLPEGKIQLDFRQYFYNFCLVHGEPVLARGRLIFADGWSYSATEYKGPEFAPPTDNGELDKVVLEYWIERKAYLDRLLLSLLHERDTLQKVQDSFSLPLQQIVKRDEYNKDRTTNLDLGTLDTRIAWIRRDLVECVQRLIEIQEYNKGA